MSNEFKLGLAEERIAQLEVIVATQQKQIERLMEARDIEKFIKDRAIQLLVALDQAAMGYIAQPKEFAVRLCGAHDRVVAFTKPPEKSKTLCEVFAEEEKQQNENNKTKSST